MVHHAFQLNKLIFREKKVTKQVYFFFFIDLTYFKKPLLYILHFTGL